MNREIEKVLISNLNTWRCVALLGSRQVGKSYLLKNILKSHKGTLISFDDPMVVDEAKKDPVNYINQHYEPGKFLFIDEAARVPEIFNAVKLLVDQYDPKPTGICLATSGNYLLMRRIKESLAGRVHLVSIYPFSWQEFNTNVAKPGLFDLIENNLPTSLSQPSSYLEIKRQREERIIWGGYPIPTLMNEREAKITWSHDYIRTYILPLVVEQFNIRDTIAFERTAQILFTQNGHFFNANQLSKHIGISQPTASNYAQQLKAMMVIEFANIFLKNPLKRLVKQPKLFVTDPLLLHHSLGTNFSLQSAIDRNLIGRIYKSFIYNELKKTLANYNVLGELYTWRTIDKAEVDIILSTSKSTIPLEVKYSTNISRRDASGLNSFLSFSPDIPFGFIVYPGEDIVKINEKVYAIPDWWLLGCY